MRISLLFLVLCSVLNSFAQTNPRRVELLDENWKFMQKEIANGKSIDCNDTDWEVVKVPHDWAIRGPFDMNIDKQFIQIKQDREAKPDLHTGRTGALPAYGVGWYRRQISVSAQDKGKRIFIEFDGAMSNAKVFLNGEFVGEWPYGYASFSFELTEKIKFGTDNLLAVRIENKPESSRWYSGAGIYRNVRLVTTDDVHVKHWGTYITTPSVSVKKAEVCIKTSIINQKSTSQKITLVTEILNSKGEKVAKNSFAQTFQDTATFKQTLRVAKPSLWSVEAPTLYKAISKVYVGNTLKDVYETSFGIRTLRFDKDKGFFLNDQRVQIKGVCNHHDLGAIGAAVNLRATERQLEMLKEMGCNAIRTSHNPPSPELLTLCDQMGFLVMVEAFDEWKLGKNKNSYHRLFDKWAEKDLVAMIHRDRNHPSVFLWSTGNELNEQNYKSGAKVAQFLTDICHREDPTRLVTAAFNSPQYAIKNGLGDAIDVIGINYINPPWRFTSYNKIHKDYPNYIFLGSETQSTLSSTGVYKLPLKRKIYPRYPDYQLSSFDVEGPSYFTTPDEEFAMLDDCQAAAGEFVWTGFDYLGEPTPYYAGTPARSSYFGIIDFAGIKKDRFYLFQSHWSSKPMLHLLPHWNWRIRDTIPVLCYTNYPKAELFVNGVSMGVKTFDKSQPFTRYRLIWPEVIYQPGEIKVVAYDNSGKAADTKVIRTAGEQYQIVLTADRKTINADGKDLCYITAEIHDKDGNLCPTANSLIFVEVQGVGNLRALCNGDPTDQTSFASNYYRAFNGKMIIVVEPSKMPGDIVVKAMGSYLKETSIGISTK
ncbi:beta-galactosidase GalB [Flavobacterium sp. FlaQc-48]|uniref:beta-galactosidase GalB n=1 Tax=Flavobacterium sp. FlaQc-48 TaxID=3374181 RepID=UPI0037574D0F